MLYRHYKGDLYRVLANPAFHSESLEEMVVYMSLKDGMVWVRPSKMFHGLVEINGVTIPRFFEVHEKV